MKIAILHYSSPPNVGGVESVLAHHALLMAKAGHEVTILAGRGEVFDNRIPVRILPRLDSRHAEVIKIKKNLDTGDVPRSFDALRDQIKMDLMAELQGFDLLIAHNVASLHKNLALTAALNQAYQTPGFPRLILWHHDLAWTTRRYLPDMHDGYPWNVLRSKWAGATQVTISKIRRKELSDQLGIAEESIHVIPNGVDLNTFFKLETRTIQLIEQLMLNQADPLLLLPVRITERKNIELALRTLVALRVYFPNAMLLVTGPEGSHNPANAAYKGKLLKLRSELKLQGAAHFLAEVTDETLPDAIVADFYRLADALIFPSFEEGFGIPIIEAGFNSIPVFCADIPVLRELGGDEASYFGTHAKPDSIAKQIADRLEGEATSRLARRVKHGYTWDSIYRLQIGPLIREVMA
jgi:glycosyltransferase involved in cell wall biosynthesis